MRSALVIARREFRAAFNSSVPYAVALFFLLFSAVWLFFIVRFFQLDRASLRSYFSVFPLAFTLIVPALTMRSWAEERKQGTLELLLTLPFTEWQLALGKFLSSCAQLAVAVVLTVPVPLSLSALGRFDAGVLIGEYAGAALLGAAAVAVGQFASVVARNQIGAFFLCLSLLLAATLAPQLPQLVVLPPMLSSTLSLVSLAFHFERFERGVIDTRDVFYFAFVTFFFLFLTSRVALMRKWS